MTLRFRDHSEMTPELIASLDTKTLVTKAQQGMTKALEAKGYMLTPDSPFPLPRWDNACPFPGSVMQHMLKLGRRMGSIRNLTIFSDGTYLVFVTKIEWLDRAGRDRTGKELSIGPLYHAVHFGGKSAKALREFYEA